MARLGRASRWWWWGLGTLLVVLAVIVVGSWLAFAKLAPVLSRERIESALTEALHRPVRVDRVELAPWFARVAIAGVSVAAGPTWEAGTAATIGRVTVAIGISSVWRRQIVLSPIRLEDVDVRYTAAATTEPLVFPERIPDRLELGPVTAFIGTVQLVRAHVRYEDPRARRALELSDLEARATPVDGGLDASLDATTARLTAPELTETVQGVSAAARLRGDRLTLDRFGLRWRGEPITVTGDVRDLGAAPTLALTARGAVPLAAVGELSGAGIALTGVAAFDAAVNGPVTNPTVNARVTAPAVGAAGTTARNVSARLGWSDGVLNVADAAADVFGGAVRGQAVVTPAQHDARLTARVDGVQLAQVEPVLGRPLGVRGRVSASGELRGDVRRLMDGDGRFHVDASEVTLAAVPALGAGVATADVRVAGGAAEILAATARWPGATISDVAGRVKPAGPEGLRMTLAADAGKLAAAFGRDRISGQATVTATLGGSWSDLTINGRARAPALSVNDAALSAIDVPFDVKGYTARFTNATATLGQTRVDATGTAGLTGTGGLDLAALRERLRFQADARTTSARLEDLDAWIPATWRGTGRFSLAAHVEGTLAAWRATGTVTAPALTVRGEPIEELAARFEVGADGLDVSGLRGRVRGIPVDAAGAWQWGGDGHVRADVGTAPLTAVPGVPAAAELQGTARAHADLARRGGRWSGVVTATGDSVNVAGFTLGRGALDVRVRDDALAATLTFAEPRITGTATGSLATGQDVAVRVTFTDLDPSPLLRRVTLPNGVTVANVQLSGVADATVPVSSPAATRGTLALDAVRLVVNGETWRNRGPVRLERHGGFTRVTQLDLVGEASAVTVTGVIADDGRLDLGVQGRFPLALAAAVRPEISAAEGVLEVSGTVKGTTQGPEVSGGGSVGDGRIVLRDLPDQPLTAVRARFTLTPERLRVSDAAATVAGGDVRASGDIVFAQPASRLGLKLAGRLPLALLPALRPEVREAAGFADVTVTIAGTTAAPQAVGEATVQGARLTLRDYPESLRDIRARVTASTSGLRIASATAAFAGGEIAVTGDVALKGGREVNAYRLVIVGRHVSLEPTAGFQSSWDAELELVGYDKRALLRGDVRLLRGTYVSEQPLLKLVFERRAPGGAPPGLALPLDIRVRLDDNLVVRTTVARFRAGGTLSLQGTTAAPVLFGTADTREGLLIFRQQRFTLTAASARFADPRRIDPILDVQAEARIQSYDVTLRMTGRLEALEIHLSASPSLPEEDVLSLVAFGTTRAQLTKGGPTAAAGEMAGLILRDFFGLQAGESGASPVDIFEIQTPEDHGRTMRVGKRVGDRTTVLYSQGLENTDERRLRLEYQLVGPLVVAGEQNFRGGFGADVLLRLRFR
ncbi:MAG TPA: translocation/assembly module TamB domain-containing protein [Methylomirabilota bacterium]|jgi:autotransporter translocation and assembly factor TamB